MSSTPDASPEAARRVVARNIRALAREQRVALKHLADFAGVSRSTLFAALAGRSAMTIDTLARVAWVLRVPPARLLEEGPAPAGRDRRTE